MQLRDDGAHGFIQCADHLLVSFRRRLFRRRIAALQRVVDGLVCEVEEERRLLVSGDELGGILCQQVCGIARLVFEHPVFPPIQLFLAVACDVRVVIHVAADIAAELIEAVVHRVKTEVVSEMPFANERGAVAGLLEHCGQREFRGRKAPRPSLLEVLFALRTEDGRKVRIRDFDAPLLVSPREQRGPRRAAKRTVAVKVRQPHAAGRETVDVGSLDFGVAVAPERAVAQVIGENEHDIGPGGGYSASGGITFFLAGASGDAFWDGARFHASGRAICFAASSFSSSAGYGTS